MSHWKSAHKQECAQLAAAASGTSPASAAGRTAPAAAAPPTDEEVAAAVDAFDRFAEALRRQTREVAADADERGIGGSGDQAVFITQSIEGKGRAAFAIRDIAQYTIAILLLCTLMCLHDSRGRIWQGRGTV